MPTITKRTVVGEWYEWHETDGTTPAAGQVIFTPSNYVVDANDGFVVADRQIVATLDSNGQISIDLPVTDDPDHEPAGWFYRVEEVIGGLTLRSYDLEVPESADGTPIDLAGVDVDAAPPSPASEYVTQTDFDSHDHDELKLDYDWDGTKLGVKLSNEDSYTYTQLRGLLWQGTWDSSVVYNHRDAVFYSAGGNSWFALQDTDAGDEPSVSSKWEKLAEKGSMESHGDDFHSENYLIDGDDSGYVLGGDGGTSTGAVAVGPDAFSGSNYAFSAGDADAWTTYSIAIGTGAYVDYSDHGIAVGRSSYVEGFAALAVGDATTAHGSRSAALGRHAGAPNAYEGVLGVDTSSAGPYDWTVPGDFTVEGSKNFDIPHPIYSERRIQHGSYEGPVSGGLIYEGSITTADGDVRVALPDYVPHISHNLRVHVTPESLALVAGHIDHDANEVVIKADLADVTVHWIVTGERNDASVQGVIPGERHAGLRRRGSPKVRTVEESLDDGTHISRLYKAPDDDRVTNDNDEQASPTELTDDHFDGATVRLPDSEGGSQERVTRDDVTADDDAATLIERARERRAKRKRQRDLERHNGRS